MEKLIYEKSLDDQQRIVGHLGHTIYKLFVVKDNQERQNILLEDQICLNVYG